MKKLLSLFVAMTAVISLSAKTIYCQAPAWWGDGAATAVYAWADGVQPNTEWPGVRMEAVENEKNLWKFDLDEKYTQVIFTRVNPKDCAQGEADCNFYWGAKTDDLSVPTDKDLYTITSAEATWDPSKVAGEWSKYGEEPQPKAKFYITGEKLTGSWEPNALPSYETTYAFENLAAGEYLFKITVDGTWATAKGYTALTTVAPGVLPAETDDNIYFKLDEAGRVAITYDGTYFFLNGNFHVDPEPAKKYFLKNNWDGALEWSWKEMTMEDENDYRLINVVYGGSGVNISSDPENDKDPKFVATKDITVYDGKLGALDTVAIFFVPQDVNQYTGASGLYAQIIGKYVEPAKPLFHIAGEGEGLSWDAEKWIAAFDKSHKLALKAGEYKLKVVVGNEWKGFRALTTVAEGLIADGDDNICFELKEEGEVNVHFDGQFFFLNGNFYVKPAEPKTYYMKNNWEGKQEWSWKEMVRDTEDETRETHVLANVVFGGTGVNINTKAEDGEDAIFIAAEDIEAFDAALDPAKLGTLDTITLIFHPEEYNRYNPKKENGLAAIILGKYVEPVKPLFYIAGEGEGLSWEADKWIEAYEVSHKLTLKAGEYKLKVVAGDEWKGYRALTWPVDGLSADGDDNICFELKEDGEVSVHFEAQSFFLRGNFYVAPAEPKTYYMKNNWEGKQEWSWKEMVRDTEDETRETHVLANVVFGGTGVNINTKAEDGEDAIFIAAEDIEAFDAALDPAKLGTLDTITLIFHPEEYNRYNPKKENGLAVIILGKYVEPVKPKFHIAGEGEGLSWDAEKWIESFEVSHKLALKAGDYKLKVVVGNEWKGFRALTTVAEGLAADGDDNIIFKLDKDGEVNVHFDGEFFFLNGNFYVAPVEPKTYYMKNNWEGAKDWSWKKMTLDTEDNRETHVLEGVVFGGTGVNINTEENDEGAIFIKMENIEAFDAALDPAKLGALDTVVFMFRPDEYNRYDPKQNGLTALIIGKYVAPILPKFYIAGEGGDLSWDADKRIVSYEDSYKLALKAGDYKLKVVAGEEWKGFHALTTIAEGLSADENDNILFTLDADGEVNVHFDGEFFFLNGKFHVDPVPAKTYYMKNNWEGSREWSWKEMILDTEDDTRETHVLANVVFGGTGVNINTKAEDGEDAIFIAAEDIEAFDAALDPAKLGTLDTITLIFHPEEYNRYNPKKENGLAAIILGKYVAVPEPEAPDFYIAGAGEGLSWDKAGWIPVEGKNDTLALKAGDYKLKVVVGEEWKGFHALTVAADGLSADEDDNICFTLKADGEVNVHYEADAFFLNGNFYVAPVEPKTYYMKNNWEGAKDWSWKKMTLDTEDNRETHVLEGVVFGGTGVNINTEENDEGAIYIAAENIAAFDANLDPTRLGALDTVIFIFHPEEYNRYDPKENGLAALIIGKYVAPILPQFYIAGEGGDLSWDADKRIVSYEKSYKLDLKAGDYKLKVIAGEEWKGFHALTTVADGLSADENDNILFTLDEDGEVNVHYEAEFFFLNGKFHVDPVPAKTYYMKNNWEGSREWSWKEMILDTEDETRETHVLANVVFGGTGVNINTKEEDNEESIFIATENIEAFDLAYEPAKLGVLDTVVFIFHPEEYNRYNPKENGLAALIVGKYVAPAEPLFCIAGEGEGLSWDPEKWIASEEVSHILTLKAGEYKLKVVAGNEWKGFHALTVAAEGLSADEDDNICFELKEDGEVSVHFEAESFFLDGKFYVKPAEPKKYFMKNNWDGGREWSWKEMILDDDPEETRETHVLANVVFGGTGVNINTEENDEGAIYIAAENIDAFDLAYEPAVLGANDTVVFYFRPEDYNRYDPKQNGLGALIIGKYVAPAGPKFYIAGEGGELSWDAEKWIASDEVSHILTLKAGEYKLKVVADGEWKGFHALTTVVDGLSADQDDNICFKLDEDGEVNVHYEANFFFLNGKFHVDEEPAKTYYMKNNWNGGRSWTWEKMTLDTDPEETRETHVLEGVVFGGTGVNINTEESDEGAIFIAAENIQAFDMAYEPAVLGVLDTVIFIFRPEEYNRYNPKENGLAALIVGKYVAPAEPLFYIAGEGEGLSWNEWIASDEISHKLALKAGDYKLKIIVENEWMGFRALTTVAEGLKDDANDNICFKLDEDGEVNVHFDGQYFFLNGNFHVDPIPAPQYFLKNNWDGAEAWTWKEMTMIDANDYRLEGVVFGGGGVNINTAADDEGAKYIKAEDITAFDANYEPAVLGALDTVAFYFDPEAVNQYTGENGLSALIIGKYVAPAEPKFYITGEKLAGSWEPNALPSYETTYVFENLAAGEYVFKITVDGTWATAKGFSDLTTVVPGVLQTEDNDNIYFKLDEAGRVGITFDGTYFFLTGNFHVDPVEPDKYFLQNNWDEAATWTWREMVLDVEEEELTYVLREVVFGGTGVKLNTAADEEGAIEIKAEDIEAFMVGTYEPAVLEAGDKVTFVFKPENVNKYTGENGLAVIIIEKHTQGLFDIDAENKAVKVMINGALMIMKNGKTYTATGELVK